MTLVDILCNLVEASVSKLLSMVDQSLLDCLVSCQDHYFLGTKMNCEH